MKKRVRIGRAPAIPGEVERADGQASLSCPKPWDALEESSTPGVRYCADCRKNVFEVDNVEQMHEAAEQDRCVAIASDSSYFKDRSGAMTSTPHARRLATVTLLVRDYDEAIRFFTEALRFELLEDTPRGPGKRWVVVAPSRGAGAALLLAKAADDEQQAAVGNQAGGRVFLFLHTQDFAADHAHMKAHGVRFLEEPRHEPHGTVAVFQDLCSNKWDLLQPA
ncbi:VOC family protein [Variovorax boronicumulans]|uniref:VOC family protein n=1 Tax=Variovorax boronicumulans TaxID=436515 RepID=UPI00348C44B0